MINRGYFFVIFMYNRFIEFLKLREGVIELMGKGRLKALALTLAASMVLTMTPVTAFAYGETPAVESSEEVTVDVALVSGNSISENQMPFFDVEKNKYYTEAVEWAYRKNVVAGTSGTTFSPNEAMSRAQIMTVLWRYFGNGAVTAAANPFSDVTATAANGSRTYFYDSVLWAAQNGYAAGTGAGKFSPYTASTRAMALTFLYNVMGKPSHRTANPFLDVPAASYYYHPALWAYENGITNGVKEYVFGSRANVTRAQFVTWLYNIAEKKTAGGRSMNDDVASTFSKVYNDVDYSAAFDYGYYFANHPKEALRFGNEPEKALEYFVNEGVKAGQQASENFDVVSYSNANQDLRIKYGVDYSKLLTQYVTEGYAEDRKTVNVKTLQNPIVTYKGNGFSAIYDFNYYVTHYPDTAVYANDDVGAIRHFVEVGLKEYRTAKEGVAAPNSVYLKFHDMLYPITVSSDPYANKANQYTSKTNYMIFINKNEHHVYILEGFRGNWKRVKDFACGDGAAYTPTPLGVFEIGDRVYYFDSGSVRCFYATRIHGGVMFHSTLYAQTSSPRYEVDGRVGLALSHGCVRCKIQNAKWIYDNIPAGTTCVVFR